MGETDPTALGNVGPSLPFQFSLVETASYNGPRSSAPWTPRTPKGKNRVLATNRWVYAIEVGDIPGQQIPILAAEYRLDKKGNLGFVSGAKRRAVDAKDDGPPAPASVPAASLPLVRNGKKLRYRFIATLGRLGKAAIASMENWLDPIYEAQDLANTAVWFHMEGGGAFVDVVDPLVIARSLHDRYERALNETLRFTTAKAGVSADEKNATEVRTRRYQLASLMKSALLAPRGELTDPMRMDDSLNGGAAAVMKVVSDYEDKVESLKARQRVTARELRAFLMSKVWDSAKRWYMGGQALKDIGHFWFAASCECLGRLSETPEGRDYLRDLVAEESNDILSFLYPPEPGSLGEEIYGDAFPVVRKSATAAVIAFCETAPAVILYSKIANPHERVATALENLFLSTEVRTVLRGPRGRIAQLVVKTNVTVTFHVEISYKKAKVDYEKWLEEGKPHWPEGTKQAQWSEIVGHLFVGVELVNLYNTLRSSIAKATAQDADGKKKFTALAEATGACLDLAVALEDPIRGAAKHLDSLRRGATEVAEHGHEAASAAAHGAGEAEGEVAGIFSKMAQPAMFKALGAISAVIDTVCYYREGNEALDKHETGLAAGRYVVSGGSALIAVASVLNAAGYIYTASAGATAAAVGITAAASVIMVAGVIVLVVGFIIIAYFTTSAWWKFGDHSVFGKHAHEAGHEAWSGGDFSKWLETKAGLDQQLLVLTNMLCSFKVAGDRSDYQTVLVTFGSIPPGAKLHVEFTITYENGPTHKPGYVIDLDSGDYSREGDAKSAAVMSFSRSSDHRIESLLLRADRPASMVEHGRVSSAKAEIVMRYAPQTASSTSGPASAATGIIPISGKLVYEMYKDGIQHAEEIDSLEWEPKEGEGESQGNEAAGEAHVAAGEAADEADSTAEGEAAPQ